MSTGHCPDAPAATSTTYKIASSNYNYKFTNGANISNSGNFRPEPRFSAAIDSPLTNCSGKIFLS